MNIVYFTHYTGVYGANKSLLELIINLKNNYNINPIVITPKSGEFNKIIDKENIENYSFEFYYCKYLNTDNQLKRLLKYFRYKIVNTISLLKIRRLFRTRKISIVHSNSSCIDIGCLLAYKIKAKHLWHVREFGEEDYNLSYYKGNQNACKFMETYSEKIIFISNALKNKYINFFHNYKKIDVVYNGVNIKNYYINIKDKNFNKNFNVVLTGLICKEKNQIDLIKSAEKLINKKKLNDIKIYFLGDGEEKYISKLKLLVKNMKIEDNIIFVGRVENVKEYLKNSQVGVITSNKEAFGRVTIEYMLGGVAVIASNSGANPEIIKDGVNGLLYNLKDIENLTEKIELLYKNRQLLKKISMNGQDNALNKFTSDLNCKKIYDIYTKMINE